MLGDPGALHDERPTAAGRTRPRPSQLGVHGLAPARRVVPERSGIPAQHGTDGSGHLVGEVTGFVLRGDGLPTICVSGDNASLEVVRAITARLGPFDAGGLSVGGAQTR